MNASDAPNEARAAWIALIQKCLERLHGVYFFEQTIPDETVFRDEFFQLPKRLITSNPDRNYNQFVRYHDQMLSIIRGLDRALQLVPPNTLGDVFWTHALVALQAGMKHEIPYSEVSTIALKLNDSKAIPEISSDLPQFPRSERVQAPLQAIFSIYINCYFVLIEQYAQARNSTGVNIRIVTSTIDDAASEYRRAEDEWRARIQEEKDEQLTYAMKHMSSGEAEHKRDSRFEHIRDLGRGTYGFVDEVREVTTGSIYARKSIPVQIPGQDSEFIKGQVKNEVAIMSSKLRHNHIASVNIYFREEEFWSMIMLPVADYDLRRFLEDMCIAEGYPQNILRMLDPWFGCLISALAYAHAESVKHEDIKPNNILIKDGKVYLTDFGTAKDFTGDASTATDFVVTGTPVYWPPDPKPWNRAADVFALGCVFAEMLTVRQKRSLKDFRSARYDDTRDMPLAFRYTLSKTRDWLKRLEPSRTDTMAQTILEQTLNMLTEDSSQRLEAPRVRGNLSYDRRLFCNSCAYAHG